MRKIGDIITLKSIEEFIDIPFNEGFLENFLRRKICGKSFKIKEVIEETHTMTANNDYFYVLDDRSGTYVVEEMIVGLKEKLDKVLQNE